MSYGLNGPVLIAHSDTGVTVFLVKEFSLNKFVLLKALWNSALKGFYKTFENGVSEKDACRPEQSGIGRLVVDLLDLMSRLTDIYCKKILLKGFRIHLVNVYVFCFIIFGCLLFVCIKTSYAEADL